MDTNADRIITQAEAAALLGLTRVSVYRLVARGLLPHVESTSGTGGGRRRKAAGTIRMVRASDVAAFAARYPVVGNGKKRTYKPHKIPAPRAPRPDRLAEAGYITQSEAARSAGLCQAMMARLVADGVVPSVVDSAGIRRIPRVGLEAWAAAGCPRPSIRHRNRPGPGLTPKEVAEKMGCDHRNVYLWMAAGELKATRHGWRWAIDAADFERFRRQYTVRPYRNLRRK